MIIAVKDKDRVVIACTITDAWRELADSDYVDDENLPIKITSSGKVFVCSNMNRFSDIILFDNEFLNMDVNPKNIVKEIIPYIKEKVQACNYSLDNEGRWHNAMVICDNEHIYDISPSFYFKEEHDYICHGYNVENLISALDELKGLEPEERIMKALSFVCRFEKTNFFPIVIIDTKNKQFKRIYKGEL